jgi:hypothetical protein
MIKKLFITLLLLSLFFIGACSESGRSTGSGDMELTLAFSRIASAGPDPFTVTVYASEKGNSEIIDSGDLTVSLEKGSLSAFTENSDGSVSFTVTPSTTGVYPLTVTYKGAVISRKALVVNEVLSGAGQPLLVEGLVNTEGYEDGITITPDGEYLFIQYGPLYFSGIFLLSTICQDDSWSLYDLEGCTVKADSDWVFNTIGPYSDPERPGFPDGAISDGTLTHLDITVATVAQGIALFPTAFYGFKRQDDGSFAEPFKVAFNDEKGANGPYGLSFVMNGDGTAKLAFAWNNYFDGLGDDKADIYQGTITLGEDNSLGDVVYSGEFYSSITPSVSPVGFSSHTGVQGNPHLHADDNGDIVSIWTDDEESSHDITLYTLSSGSYPDGSWTSASLPSKINTGSSESQPFFDGEYLYINRETAVVRHKYLGGSFTDDASWSDEEVVVKSGESGVGTIFGAGEPTVAEYNGKTLLYFVYVESRAEGEVGGRYDYDMGAAWVELP